MKILAVDDEPYILELMPLLAARVGFSDVTTFSSAVDALDTLVNGKAIFDCLLLDINMPDMDGIELLERWGDERQREVVLDSGSDDDSADPLEHMAFKADGHYAEKPAEWGNPEQDLNSRQFFAVLEACTDKLPPVQGRLFLMREWLEMSSEEICKELALTPTNLYVQLHRARLRLRECLDLNWFQQPRTR